MVRATEPGISIVPEKHCRKVEALHGQENEIKAYLNFYREIVRMLANEEKDPPEPRQEDYLSETGMLPDDFEIRLENDRRLWNENKADIRTRSRFLATTLVQACHNNKKGSELTSSAKPGDWKKIWEILRIHYCPMGSANKVDLMKGFMKLTKYSPETLSEFIARFDNEIHNIRL